MVLSCLIGLLDFFKIAVFSVGYIQGGNLFPEPLSMEDEKKYLEKYKKTGDEESRNILIERNLRLVAHIVKKFDPKGSLTDDLISIGTIGLIKGIDTYKDNKKTKITTYAARGIQNAHLTLWNYMTYSKQHLKHYKTKCKQVIV